MLKRERSTSAIQGRDGEKAARTDEDVVNDSELRWWRRDSLPELKEVPRRAELGVHGVETGSGDTAWSLRPEGATPPPRSAASRAVSGRASSGENVRRLSSVFEPQSSRVPYKGPGRDRECWARWRAASTAGGGK